MQKLRLEFWSKIRDIPIEDLIFLDEAGVNLALVRLYARALRGNRAKGTRPQKRGKNVSMIAAIALTGIVTSINLLGATDGLTFEAFVIQNLFLTFGKGQQLSGITALFTKEKRLNSLLEKLGQD